MSICLASRGFRDSVRQAGSLEAQYWRAEGLETLPNKQGDGDALGASIKPSWMESTSLVGRETHVVGRKCCRLPRQTALT